MALVQGKYGTYTQGAGGVVFSIWKGKNVMMDKSASYSDANSLAQQAVRRKFSLCTKWARNLLSTLKVGFKTAAASMTEMNMFTSQNYEHASDDGSASTFSKADVIVSKGAVQGIDTLNVGPGTNAGDLSVQAISTADGVAGFDSDVLYLGIRCDAEDGFRNVNTGVTRANAGTAFDVPTDAAWSGRDCDVYAFFKSASAATVSDTKYAEGAAA